MRVVPLTSLIAGTSVALLATPLAASSAIPASPGNRSSYAPDISSNGRFVVFASDATNLVAGDTNGKRDIFLRDMVTKSTRLVSKVGTKLANAHNYSPAVSDDGRYVAFLSDASNLVTGDTNGKTDAFRADLTSGEIVRVSTGNAGQQGNGIPTGVNMSANGAIISFDSTSTNLVTGDRNKSEDVFRRDFSSGQFSRLSGFLQMEMSLRGVLPRTIQTQLSGSGTSLPGRPPSSCRVGMTWTVQADRWRSGPAMRGRVMRNPIIPAATSPGSVRPTRRACPQVGAPT